MPGARRGASVGSKSQQLGEPANHRPLSSVGMAMEQKSSIVCLTLAISAAERAVCAAKWAAPLAPRSWNHGRRAAAALLLQQAR